MPPKRGGATLTGGAAKNKKSSAFGPVIRLVKNPSSLIGNSAELATAKIGHDSRHLFIFPHFYRPSNIGFKSSPLKALCLKGHGNPKFATTRSFRAQFRLVLVYGRTVHDSNTAPAPERAPAGIWPGCQIAADRYAL